jgi:hypothetical protein
MPISPLPAPGAIDPALLVVKAAFSRDVLSSAVADSCEKKV